MTSIGAVGLEDADRARGAYPVAVQEQHDLANDLLVGPARDDPLGALGANPGHLAQTVGLLLDDLEYRRGEGANQLLCVDRADAVDYPRAEIFFDALGRRGWHCLEERGPELDAMCAVVDPGSVRLDKLAGRNHRRVTQVALTAGLHPQHAEPILLIVERDALDQAGQNFGRRVRLRSLRHRRMMKIESRRCYRVKRLSRVRQHPATPAAGENRDPTNARAAAISATLAFTAGSECINWRRARVQDKSASWISCSLIFVISRAWPNPGISSAVAGLARSLARSRMFFHIAPICDSTVTARCTRSGG
jgi:hypothetical protein